MKKLCLILIVSSIILIGCKISGKYEIQQDGKGTGKIKVENFNKSIFLSRLNEDEKYNKIHITSIDSISPEIFIVNIKWDKFEDVFTSMKHLDDGNIELDLGQSDFPLQVRIDGVIDPKRSSGNLIDVDNMEFKYGKAILTYLPEESFSIVKLLLISGIVLLVYFVFFKGRK